MVVSPLAVNFRGVLALDPLLPFTRSPLFPSPLLPVEEELEITGCCEDGRPYDSTQLILVAAIPPLLLNMLC